MLATFWNTTNLANYGTILGGIAVITGGATIFWKMLMSHLRKELSPVKQLERNGGSSVADLVHKIAVTQEHIHKTIDKMDKELTDNTRDLDEHLGWHKGKGHV